jgi:hypothetical protein
MDKLWAKRRPPVPIDWADLPGPKIDTEEIGLIRDQQMWTIAHCVEIFSDSVNKLCQKFKVTRLFSVADARLHVNHFHTSIISMKYVFNFHEIFYHFYSVHTMEWKKAFT